MEQHILNVGGGKFDYSAPTLEILTVQVEQGFAASGEKDAWAPVDPWDDKNGESLDF